MLWTLGESLNERVLNRILSLWRYFLELNRKVGAAIGFIGPHETTRHQDLLSS
jgi:hypothetical protein